MLKSIVLLFNGNNSSFGKQTSITHENTKRRKKIVQIADNKERLKKHKSSKKIENNQTETQYLTTCCSKNSGEEQENLHL